MAHRGLCRHVESAFGHLMNSDRVIMHCTAFKFFKSNMAHPSIDSLWAVMHLKGSCSPSQASFTAHRTLWPSLGFVPNWAASRATVWCTRTKSQTWTWTDHWASTLWSITWLASSVEMWVWLQPLRSQKKVCLPAHRQLSWQWSSSRAEQRWGSPRCGEVKQNDV